MRYGPKLEAKILDSIRENPEAHIRLPADMYRDDGQVMTYRDNRQQMVHRRLWEMVNGRILGRREYLLRGCSVDRCINPHHRVLSTTPHPGVALTTCPNGHRYTPENMMPKGCRDRCKKCRADRLARRRKKDAERRRAARKERDVN